MAELIISEEKLNKVLVDFEVLLEDIASRQDEIAKKRIADIRANPSIGKSEKELDDYLRKRGVKID